MAAALPAAGKGLFLLRILVIGASGFIGRFLVRRLGAASEHELFCTFRSRPPGEDVDNRGRQRRQHWHQLELTDPVELEKLFGRIQPDGVVHLAAMADVGTAEREPEMAAAINVVATSEIARLSESFGARLIFVSSEYVFDGQRGFYREDDAPNPTTQYGRTKRDAERGVTRLAFDGSILRTSLVYGWPAPGRRNFVPALIERLQKGETYNGSTQVMRTPVYVERLVEGMAALVENYHPGIHHVAGRDWVSMYDLAKATADAFELDSSLVIPDNVPLPSPDRLGLDCARTMELLGLEPFGLAEGLAAMRNARDGRY